MEKASPSECLAAKTKTCITESPEVRQNYPECSRQHLTTRVSVRHNWWTNGWLARVTASKSRALDRINCIDLCDQCLEYWSSRHLLQIFFAPNPFAPAQFIVTRHRHFDWSVDYQNDDSKTFSFLFCVCIFYFCCFFGVINDNNKTFHCVCFNAVRGFGEHSCFANNLSSRSS